MLKHCMRSSPPPSPHPAAAHEAPPSDAYQQHTVPGHSSSPSSNTSHAGASRPCIAITTPPPSSPSVSTSAELHDSVGTKDRAWTRGSELLLNTNHNLVQDLLQISQLVSNRTTRSEHIYGKQTFRNIKHRPSHSRLAVVQISQRALDLLLCSAPPTWMIGQGTNSSEALKGAVKGWLRRASPCVERP